MNISEIRKLVEIIKANDLTEFELDEGDFSIRIRRGGYEGSVVMPQMAQPASQPLAAAPIAAAPVTSSQPSAPAEEAGVETINSPMVGTFYRSPSPDSAPFVSEGASIKEDSVVCIIEAMKVMNEIQAEIKGSVVEILVADGEPVEFGQPLLKVKTA
jgi:acetyl-CoA carboxylase biotin carboxyl carrier protein